MSAHISSFTPGTYKKAHRHGPGAHVIVVSGEGYTLMWEEGHPVQRFDWKAGSMIVPPKMWFHQHFNVGKEIAQYLALHERRSKKYKSGQSPYAGLNKNVKEGGNQIEYEDEDPIIRKMFEEELAKRGVKSKMPQFNK